MMDGVETFATSVGRVSEDGEFVSRAYNRKGCIVDSSGSNRATNALDGLRPHSKGWSPRGCCNFKALTAVLLLVPDEVPCAQPCEVVSLRFLNSKAGKRFLRSLGETVHDTRPGGVLHFNFLYVGEGGPLTKSGLDDGDEFKGILVMLVMMDDLSTFV